MRRWSYNRRVSLTICTAIGLKSCAYLFIADLVDYLVPVH